MVIFVLVCLSETLRFHQYLKNLFPFVTFCDLCLTVQCPELDSKSDLNLFITLLKFQVPEMFCGYYSKSCFILDKIETLF